MSAHALRKAVRFVRIYGVGRTWFKVAGRLRLSARLPRWRSGTPDIGIIGCGQFAFATIAFFVGQKGGRIASCFDIDPSAQQSFARAMAVPDSPRCAEEMFARPGLRAVYIASNHASHTPYAVQALSRGIDTYIEKPVAVSFDQLVALLHAKSRSSARVFAGYNRPFSAAVRALRARTVIDASAGISMQCFVVGHSIGADHWYRRPEEGTRVCGNLGHWLDLMVHVLSWRGLPDRLDISLTWADDREPDDNVCVAIRSDRADVVSLMLTSRCEPFEGINETINFQHGETIAKIDDFRRIALWQGPRLWKQRFWPKDVGHRLAILQPFTTSAGRDWHEVELSTLLMLHITDMVRQRVRQSSFSFSEQWAPVQAALARMAALPDSRSPVTSR